MWKELKTLRKGDSLTSDLVDHDRVLEGMRDNKLADGCSAQEYSHRIKMLQRWHIPHLQRPFPDDESLAKFLIELMPEKNGQEGRDLMRRLKADGELTSIKAVTEATRIVKQTESAAVRKAAANAVMMQSYGVPPALLANQGSSTHSLAAYSAAIAAINPPFNNFPNQGGAASLTSGASKRPMQRPLLLEGVEISAPRWCYCLHRMLLTPVRKRGKCSHFREVFWPLCTALVLLLTPHATYSRVLRGESARILEKCFGLSALRWAPACGWWGRRSDSSARGGRRGGGALPRPPSPRQHPPIAGPARPPRGRQSAPRARRGGRAPAPSAG